MAIRRLLRDDHPVGLTVSITRLKVSSPLFALAAAAWPGAMHCLKQPLPGDGYCTAASSLRAKDL